MKKTVVMFGECMLELRGQAFGMLSQAFGGDTLNTAVYLARCSRANLLDVQYVTGIGDDTLSAQLTARWKDEGIGIEMCRTVASRLPGIYLIDVGPGGERAFSYWRENSAARAYFDCETSPIEETNKPIDCFYFSGISMAILPIAGRERLFAVIRSLRDVGCMVVFDNNFRPSLWPDLGQAQACFSKAFALANTCLVTADDHMTLFGLRDIETATMHALQNISSNELIVKRGSDPTLIRQGTERILEIPTIPVAKVVDTTAAGDSFAGAYLSKRMFGDSPAVAAAFGNRLAATVIQHHGALIPRDLMTEFL